MKKFIITLAAFAVFSTCAYIILLFIHGMLIPIQLRGNLFLYSRSHDFSMTRIKEADTSKNIDLLILGSSHAYRGYDTRVFQEKGIRAFNFGTSAQTLIQTSYLLDKYLDRLNPKTVIIDVYPVIFNDSGLESTLQLLSIMPIDKRLYEMALSYNDIRAYNTLLFYTVKNGLGLYGYKSSDIKNSLNTYVKGGFVENFTQGKIQPKKKKAASFSSKQQDNFRNIIEKLKEKGVNYYISQTPTTETDILSITNIAEMDKILSSYGKYYNYNIENTMPDTCFIDNNHLNAMGAKIYSEFVMKNMFFKKGI